MNKLAPLFALLLAACPESIGQQCPIRTVSVGQYSLAFSARHDAGECIATLTDGGSLPLTLDDAGVRGATLCSGTAGDGGPQLWLVVTGKSPRSSDLLGDGGFHFAGHTDPTPGIVPACGGTCQIGIDEIFDGLLLTGPTDGGFGLEADGGLPFISGLSGTLTDHLTTPSGTCPTAPDAGSCNAPCSVTYSIAGTRF